MKKNILTLSLLSILAYQPNSYSINLLSNGINNEKKISSASSISYDENGFQFKTEDDLFSLTIQNRIQARYATPFDSDPRSLSDLEKKQSSFIIRRARTKLNGNAYWSWLKYSFQYDWKDPILRDVNLTMEKYSWAKLWFGRGKVIYNNERVTSSAKQQFVNRSIVNDIFTLDRQEGLQISGNLFPETWHDLTYNAGVFTGLGVGEQQNDDNEMMYSGRLQWNILGKQMSFSQSDIELHEKPALSVAAAAATNKSKCTAFSTSDESCQSLPGFNIGEAGQYRINQLMEEIVFKWQGLSIQHEFHLKEVTDSQKSLADSRMKTQMIGSLVQAGYFPHLILPLIPEDFEVAARYAFVDPNIRMNKDLQQELSLVLTYFLNEHNNKLNFQISHLLIEGSQLNTNQAGQRLWLQWDISF